jgi:hypothetical protein
MFRTLFNRKSTQEVGRNYPFDFNGAEKHTRFKTGYDYWPTHSNRDNFAKLGLVAGLWAEQDMLVWAQGYGRMPSGPIVSALPVNLTWQITVPGLTKQDNP